ncbi:unnamed protein product [Discosporangium mesarthrocarpum]
MPTRERSTRATTARRALYLAARVNGLRMRIRRRETVIQTTRRADIHTRMGQKGGRPALKKMGGTVKKWMTVEAVKMRRARRRMWMKEKVKCRQSWTGRKICARKHWHLWQRSGRFSGWARISLGADPAYLHGAGGRVMLLQLEENFIISVELLVVFFFDDQALVYPFSDDVHNLLGLDFTETCAKGLEKQSKWMWMWQHGVSSAQLK